VPTPLQTQLESVAANVRRRRAQLGLTQEALAELAGMDVRFLQRLESGSVNMRLETLLRVAEPLGVTAARLLRPAVLPAGVPGRPSRRRTKAAKRPRRSG
jgi:transcriptional regulator with XRE-family HTH domain